MDANEFGLDIKVSDLGHFNARFEKGLHEVKSLAGSLFHLPKVVSVCVYNSDGVAHLYLKKTDSGVHREER